MDLFLFVLLLLLAAMVAIIALIYRYAWMKARIPVLVQREFNEWKGAAEFEMQERIRSRVEEWRDRETQTILAEAQRDSLFEAHKLFKEWCEGELEAVRREQRELALREARNKLSEWMLDHEKNIRQDAVHRSQAVTTGKIVEHLVPYLPNFNYNPKDARFVGSPVDFIVFDGLSDDEDDQLSIVFVEIKTGMATLTRRERMVRDAIKAGRVKWVEWHASNELQQAAPGTFE
ncbi:MAG TPA: Holliday junction resolvase-like protein [Blastocatellia bacterium]|nr:Holliday junction resolvase-like protein [Blastocatellia bacterium]